MYISQVGIKIAESKDLDLQRQLAEISQETADCYKNSGDTWHDNPAWNRAAQIRGIIEGQLLEFRYIMSENKTIIDRLSFDPTVISIGSSVCVEYGDGDYYSFTILGPVETNGEQIISYDSPIAKAVLGKKVGDTVLFNNERITILTNERWERLDPLK